jgi:uncharacterized membrane protein
MNTFSAGEAIRFAWETFKKRTWFFVGMTVVIAIASWVIGASVGAITASSDTASISLLSFLLNLSLSALLNAGVVAYALKAHDTPEKAEVFDLWHPQVFLPYLVATVLVFICVAIGFVLLVVPGIIVGLMLMFTPYLVVDKNLGAIEAMKESKRITQGSKWQLFELGVSLFLLNLVGALALLVGLLVTIPVSMLAIAHAYRQLAHKGGEVSASSPKSFV